MVKSKKSDGLAANSSKMLIKSTVAVKNCHNYTWEELGDWGWHFEGNRIRQIES